jgi:hypothetical protein
MKPPETRYARSGDVRIAYQVLGGGGPHLVYLRDQIDCDQIVVGSGQGAWCGSATRAACDGHQLAQKSQRANVHEASPAPLERWKSSSMDKSLSSHLT